MGSGDRSNYHGVEEDGPFGRGRAETNSITRRKNEGKKQNGKIKHLEESEDDTFGGQPKRSTVLFKYLKVRSYKRTFSLEKLVNHLLVRGTISFYNQKLQLCLLEKEKCGMYQCD